MKGLIIENEYRVDAEVLKFLKDNPTLFTEVTELICCLKRENSDIISEVLTHDAIIVASTFMYKDQLNDFLDMFLNPSFPVKTIFINDIVSKLNNWKYCDDQLSQEPEIFEKVRLLLAKGTTIYNYFDGKGMKKDYTKLMFSMTNQVFYNENDEYAGYGEEMCVDCFKKGKYQFNGKWK